MLLITQPIAFSSYFDWKEALIAKNHQLVISPSPDLVYSAICLGVIAISTTAFVLITLSFH